MMFCICITLILVICENLCFIEIQCGRLFNNQFIVKCPWNAPVNEF